jgi:membrane-associated phospholipid phosphatase
MGEHMSSIPVQQADHSWPARRASTKFAHVGFLAAEIVLLALLLVLTLLVKQHPGPLTGDVGLEVDVQHALLPHAFLTQVVEAVSTLNWPVPSVITLAVIVVIFLLLKRWLDILIVIATAAVTDETSYVFNQWIRRPRPTGHGLHILSKIANFYSFPSGHVVHVTAVFGLFIFLSTQIRRPVHPLVIGAIRVVLVAAIVLMPISRMLEGEHWPTDVLAGLLYGGFWLVIAAHVYLWARNRWPRLLARDER